MDLRIPDVQGYQLLIDGGSAYGKVFGNMKRMAMACTFVVITAALAAVGYLFIAPLPSPIPPTGQVLDATTGKGVAGAEVIVRWWIYDYPMLDGEGSYELATSTRTDADGRFTLVIPQHRRGIWNTESFPPTVSASGYKTFTREDVGSIVYLSEDFVVFRLVPE